MLVRQYLMIYASFSEREDQALIFIFCWLLNLGGGFAFAPVVGPPSSMTWVGLLLIDGFSLYLLDRLMAG
jgi:hypothetical protein